MPHTHGLSPYFDLDRLVRDALGIWCTRSKEAALWLLASAVRHGKDNARLGTAINRRQNQLLTLSRLPRFELEAELRRYAVDIANL